jgi:hypothetical protein
MTQIRDAIVSETEELKSDGSVEFERTFIEKCHTAETQGRNELGELYALVEIGEEATIDGLMKELEVQERLDAMIDKCLKRLLFLKGLQSLTIESTSSPAPRLTGSPKAP